MIAVLLLHEWLLLPLAGGCRPCRGCGLCCCCCRAGVKLLLLLLRLRLLRLRGFPPWAGSQPAVCRGVLREGLGCLLQNRLPETPAGFAHLRTRVSCMLQSGAASSAPGFAQTVHAKHGADSVTSRFGLCTACKLCWHALERDDLALGGLVVPERGAGGAAEECVRIPALVYKPAGVTRFCGT